MEYWNDGSRGRKTINMTFSAFAAHYSIIPTPIVGIFDIPLFHGAES
jgi:hypothetical protein